MCFKSFVSVMLAAICTFSVETEPFDVLSLSVWMGLHALFKLILSAAKSRRGTWEISLLLDG